jgi:carbon-monoxide dehydrogenase large subunit
LAKTLKARWAALPCGWLINNPDGSPMKEPPPPGAGTRGKVRHVGDQVAMVIADSVEQAKNAAEAVVVDYDVLPAVVDVRRRCQGRANCTMRAPNNHCFKWTLGDKAPGWTPLLPLPPM